MPRSEQDDEREGYHHGGLREAPIQLAMPLIAERGLAGFAIAELARATGVSTAAPYRHFRDRDAPIIEVARRGFGQLAAEQEAAILGAGDPVAALERWTQAHLAFAAREPAVYAAVFAAALPAGQREELPRSRGAAFGVVRRAAQAGCERARSAQNPPASTVALHVWSLTHGTADLFVRHGGGGRSLLPTPPQELLEARLMVYLRSLGLAPSPGGKDTHTCPPGRET